MELFEKVNIGGLSLANRLVKSATLENTATSDGLPTRQTAHFYKRLARGEPGLIITGYAYVHPSGRSYPFQHGADSDAMIECWRPVVDTVHEHGSRIALQIVHGGRQCRPDRNGQTLLAPSRIPNLVYFSLPRKMTSDEITRTIRDFGEAAGRAREAGFDAVQIHAAHGYLISGFLSPLTNRRRDEWGGDPERRSRFLTEVFRTVRSAVGDDFPVMAKMNIHDFVPFGLTPARSFPLACRLARLGLDALEISGGLLENPLAMSRGGAPSAIINRGKRLPVRAYFSSCLAFMRFFQPFRENYFQEYAARLKPDLPIPLILVGGVRSVHGAEQALLSGAADLVSMARPLVREPDLPKKWREGAADRASCTSCNRCLGEIEQGGRLACYQKTDSRRP
ncbi:MAG: NADH:flavin oxidoreductase [Desulfomonilia bacterium]|jgi:2,4-dienoyl-CoA reductase-like NADH-dependent reductase (Old Yellow Enzyme family)|uniref:NADH oxidase n=1 Tax=anaerobic digester metagenome TaxID=1263854 RepID=A0A485LVI4_9ZZZZ|nr:NADH:flavin oxidoreductase [Pseudomonadota bacterium]HPD21042.1 NADH:flavin oxidoreductase [Deltaproteobacteria bacterium]HPX17393.1 NADH:flavin oxidoreductase [Deltaproteobacteria bacterium]HRS55305.1 NADH:flavin oxidoreductase [Desulfomonilia bacterium]HRV35554.1 NADH:flavin oxidoreductase [Desulfomonilia bacterium]